MIQFSCLIDNVKANKDRTLMVKLETQELTPQDGAQILDFFGKQIWCAFAETAITKDDLNIPEALAEFRTDKTPSQRLRNVLYKFWELKKKGTIEWEMFYRQQIERIIEFLKEKME